jgi:phage-related protein
VANQVTLTFAGETKQVEDSFDRVGESSRKMSDKVGGSAEGFAKAGEAADQLDTKAMGFRDTMTGVQDTAKGTSQILKGDLFNGFLTLGMGIGDLASGFYNLIIPALAKTKVGTLATAAASKVAAAGSKAWAAAQWIMNSALFASPITWIIVGIVALVAVIVLIARRTDWFSRAWRAAWGWIRTAASNAWDFIRKIPGWIASAFRGIASTIVGPFKSAFNGIARAWNNTVGRLTFSVPSWVPFIGGNTFSAPHLPTFHSGGIVPGPVGAPRVALLQGGEEVRSRASQADGDVVLLGSDGTRIGDAIVALVAETVARKGGRAGQLGITLPKVA